MQFHSTRKTARAVGFSEALVNGIAPDGGLYLPSEWPTANLESFGDAADLPAIAATFMAPYVAGDRLESKLSSITADAFNFPVPLVPVTEEGRVSVLELFHGPTAAFKDFGARFLAACMAQARSPGDSLLQILVARPGDTGG